MENVYQYPNSEIPEPEKYNLSVTRSTRLINFVLDIVLFLPICAVFIVTFNFIAPTDVVEHFWEFYLNESNISLNGLATLIIYFSIFESINGKSPAKYITKTRVLSKSGKKANIFQVVARSIVRAFYFEALTFLIGKNSPYGLHDLLSYTKLEKQK